MYSFWGLILGNSMFGTLLPKNDMKIADPSSPSHGLQPLKIPRRYADINYQLRRPDVLANKACYNCATAFCDLLGGKEGRFQMRCIRKCMIVSVYTQTLESYIYIFRSFKSLIHMNFRPCMTRMTLFPEHVGWMARSRLSRWNTWRCHWPWCLCWCSVAWRDSASWDSQSYPTG